jgi:L-iditol 2-dehydrogenase
VSSVVQVARLHGPGDIRVEAVPAEPTRPDRTRIRVTAVGLCGSDRHWFVEGAIGRTALREPLIPGHEFIGVVLEGPRAGERVAADPAIPCGRCHVCSAGDAHLCSAGRFAGYPGTPGALRAELTWPTDLLHAVPDGLGDDVAVLAEPLGIALHAADLAGIRGGERVGVVGCGPIGLLLIRVLDHLGATVAVATDHLTHRLEVATVLGARATLVAGPVAAVDDADLDVAFEVAGEDPAIDDAVRAVRPGGAVVLVGIPGGERSSFVAETARRKELTVRLCRRMRADDLPRALDLLDGGLLPTALVTDRYALAEAPAAFATLAARSGIKVVVHPTVAVS